MGCEIGMIELGSEQKKAVARKTGPVLLLSGAGTGKTTVLASRYAHLFRQRSQGHVLLLCPDSSAVRRMRKLVEQCGCSPAPDAWIHSFHELGIRLLRGGLLPGVPFSLYDDDDREMLIRVILREFKMHEALFKGIGARISGLKARQISPEQFIAGRDSYGFDEKLARIYSRYQEALRRNRALDFDDLVSHTVDLLEEDPSRAKKVYGSFKHVLVDDFQELTPAQYRMVQILAGSGKGLFAAGDDDQSIFAFRGADGGCLERVQEDFPQASVTRFAKNYRSTDSVLSAASAVIAGDPCRCAKNMKAVRLGEDLPVYSCTGDETEEAQHIAYLLKDLYLKDRYGYGEMCVLYRIPLQGKIIGDVLRAEGIPFHVPGARASFFQSADVRDAMCYLRVLANPHDGLSLERIINRPNRGVGEATLNRIRQEAKKRDLSLFETIEQMAKGSKTLSKVTPLLKVFRQESKNLAENADVVPLLRRLLENTGYADWILEQDGAGETAARRLGEVMAMAEGKTVRDFLDRAAFRAMTPETPGTADAVQLLTIHQASGMEFSVVFLAGFEEGVLPYMPSRRATPDTLEERRLAYVAMTRARDRLFLSGARRRKTFTGLQTQKPSRFLECLPDNLCSRFERSTRTEVVRDPPRRKRGLSKGDGGFPVGTRVRHTTWGVGVVRDYNGQGDAARVTVNFPSVGIKRLAVKFANLERI